jgi:hypothetical protein
MKIMYVKLVGTLAEMVEHHSHDKDLTEEVLGYCLELPSEEEGNGAADSSEAGEEDYDEVSVGDEEIVEVQEAE